MIEDNANPNYMIPIFPRQREVFYSSIPVQWEEIEGECVVCLPCARDTFSPPTGAKLVVNGVEVT